MSRSLTTSRKIVEVGLDSYRRPIHILGDGKASPSGFCLSVRVMLGGFMRRPIDVHRKLICFHNDGIFIIFLEL